jgi:hypothetical protein
MIENEDVGACVITIRCKAGISWDKVSRRNKPREDGVSREFRFTVKEYSTASDLERGWEKSPQRLLHRRKKYRRAAL